MITEQGKKGNRKLSSYLLDHLLPLVLRLLDLPAEALGVLHRLPQQRRLVHQLLGDAAHVDTSAACRGGD